MLKLIQVEFLKLRRRKFIWLMLLAALFMPLAAVFYFSSVKGTGVDPHYVLQMDSVQLYPVDHPTGSAGDVVYHADV
mgnify:CR=1 FL=1